MCKTQKKVNNLYLHCKTKSEKCFTETKLLDLDELELSYVINGSDYGPAVDKNNSYHFGLNKENEYRFALKLKLSVLLFINTI